MPISKRIYKNTPNKWSEYDLKKATKDDKNYPICLFDLQKPPEQIYFRGKLKNNLDKTLGVVGARRMTSYGKQALERILPNIIDQDVTIISGFMYGVDTLAHTLAVEKNAPTIAVLGNGVNQCYPIENDKLYTKILKSKGTVMSEYEPETKAKPWMYVQRNRLIAAFSTIGVLVVEASQKSGSLVTANFTLELGKPLFAIPGPITSSVSVGTNQLIKEGKAKMVTSSEDIIATKMIVNNETSLTELSTEEKNIVNLLAREQLTIDEISIKLNINAQEIGTTLTMLSMKGLVKEEAGKFVLLLKK